MSGLCINGDVLKDTPPAKTFPRAVYGCGIQSSCEFADGGRQQMAQLGIEDQTECSASSELWISRIMNDMRSQYQFPRVTENMSIYRVPRHIKTSKPQAYVPTFVSFGPLHNKDPELARMDQHKLKSLERMLTRLHIDADTLLGEIQKLESEIREHYELPICMDGKALSLMLAKDACFILEFFGCKFGTDCFGPVFQEKNEDNLMYITILGDIMKLENQIPLVVLLKVLQLECGTLKDAKKKLGAMLSKHNVFHGFPFKYSPDDDVETKLEEHMTNKPSACHLLNLHKMVIRDLLTHSNPKSTIPIEQGCSIKVALPGLTSIDLSVRPSLTHFSCDGELTPTAELLDKAGIKFQPGRLGFLKKRFGTSTLSFPQITIEDSTELWLRNLMAYEECSFWSQKDTIISQFVRLLRHLIVSEKDVFLLRKSLVIESFVGSDEKIVGMLDSICGGIECRSIQETEEVMEEVKEHYNSQWKVQMSRFKEEHCSQSWCVVFVLVVIVTILGMNVVKTVYSVKS